MSTIKIEFPAGDPAAAAAFAVALGILAGNDKPDIDFADFAEPEAPPPGKPADTAAEPETLEHSATTAEPSSSTPVDTKGVVFNAQFCANAKDPYYGTGKRMGQWKKGKGVDEAAYDAWYNGELAKLTAVPTEQTVINTASAFGAATRTPAGVPASSAAPVDVGSFMAWVSEKQAAGLLTQEQVNQGWTTAGVDFAGLFNSPPDAMKAGIAKIYGILSQIAGA